MRLRSDNSEALAGLADMQRLACSTLVLDPRLAASDTCPQTPLLRCKDQAERRRIANDQTNVHCIVVAATHELAGAVERVDEEEASTLR